MPSTLPTDTPTRDQIEFREVIRDRLNVPSHMPAPGLLDWPEFWNGCAQFNGSQLRTVRQIIRKAWNASVAEVTDYQRHEYKRLTLEKITRTRWAMVIEIGRKGDEDSMASVFCRQYFHGFIGPRGGLTWYRDRNRRVQGTRNLRLTDF